MNPQGATIGSSLAGLSATPKMFELPTVGTTMLLQMSFGNVYVVGEAQAIYDGREYVEVEVKAIKKAKIEFV